MKYRVMLTVFCLSFLLAVLASGCGVEPQRLEEGTQKNSPSPAGSDPVNQADASWASGRTYNDTSYPGAFGLALVAPSVKLQKYIAVDGACRALGTAATMYIGAPIVLVTLSTRGALAIGDSDNAVSVGTTPTVVVPYNDKQFASGNSIEDGCPDLAIEAHGGAQSALVVNTGSNTVSLLNIGYYSEPSGTVAVGSQPVAAVISPDETKAYVANYADSTVTEVDLVNVQTTRTMQVINHPTTLTFDVNGNLWVGGQGNVQALDVLHWVPETVWPVDGTVNGMVYDTSQGVLVQTILQNGSTSSLSNGGTRANAIAYSTGGSQTAYSTTQTMFVANGAITGTQIASDTAPYVQSSAASYLAFPGQTAFVPPIYSSTSGDMIATVNGNSFTVSLLSTGKVLITGSVPYPIRGVALTNTMLYFTMTDSNSLVSMPLQLP